MERSGWGRADKIKRGRTEQKPARPAAHVPQAGTVAAAVVAVDVVGFQMAGSDGESF